MRPLLPLLPLVLTLVLPLVLTVLLRLVLTLRVRLPEVLWSTRHCETTNRVSSLPRPFLRWPADAADAPGAARTAATLCLRDEPRIGIGELDRIMSRTSVADREIGHHELG